MSARAIGPDALRRISALDAGVAGVIGIGFAAWPVFVYDGSQAAYVVSTAALSVGAFALAARSRAITVFLVVAVLGLLGPDVNGTLAAGVPPLRTLRVLDAVLLAAAVGAVWGVGPRQFIGDAVRALRSPVLIGVVLLFAWAILRWVMLGHLGGQLLKTDLRLAFVGTAAWIVASRCRNGLRGERGLAFAAVGAAVAAKALMLYLADYWMIGPNDRVQAVTAGVGGHLRVILDGGDTVLILVPAVAVIAAMSHRGARRTIAAAGALFAAGALLASGTRSSLLVAVLLAIVAAALARKGRRKIRRPELAGLFVLGALFLAAAFGTGVIGRFAHHDAPGTGLDFRRQELTTITHLPTHELLLGQGLGGSFLGRDVTGGRVLTGWSHAFPAWIVLKLGVVGFIAILSLAALAAWRWRRTGASAGPGADRQVGLLMLLGILAMSFTLGRAALPDGLFLLTVGLAWIRFPQAAGAL